MVSLSLSHSGYKLDHPAIEQGPGSVHLVWVSVDNEFSKVL